MLVVFGSINVDLVFALPRLPEAGDTLWSQNAMMAPGGRGANQAVAAARDGASVTLAGAVGQDGLAEIALAGLRAAGIGLSHVARVPVDTGRAAICVDRDGYTAVVAFAGANHQARADQVPDRLLRPGTTVLVQMETRPAETAALILRAKARGCRVVLHFSPPAIMSVEALRSVDVLIGNHGELAWVGEHLGTGNNPGSLHAALGVTTVRMTGVQGAELMSDAGYLHVDAMPVQMRDTTGAGDCFAGVFAGALSRGAGLETALRRANAAAALITAGVGVQSQMPASAEIQRALPHAPKPTSQQASVMD